MNDHDSPIVRFHLRIASEVGRSITQESTILDFGCGEGRTVEALRSAGYDAYGADMERDLDAAEQAIRSKTAVSSTERILRSLQQEPYRIPFKDATFDYVFSEQVLEHVVNYDESLAENWRVMKPGGFAIHIFPSRWRPVEPHVYVPFGGVLRSEPYLRIWARLGIRNEFQNGMNWREVARANAEYLRTHTNYLPKKEIDKAVARHFHRWSWQEVAFVRHSFGRSRNLYPVLRAVPPLLHAYRAFHTRVLYLEKTA